MKKPFTTIATVGFSLLAIVFSITIVYAYANWISSLEKIGFFESMIIAITILVGVVTIGIIGSILNSE